MAIRTYSLLLAFGVAAHAVGCNRRALGERSADVSPSRQAAAQTGTERPPSPPVVATGPCAGLGSIEAIRLSPGGWFVSSTGLGVRYEGSSHDTYDDGSTDLLLALSFWTPGEQGESWLPSARAEPRYEVILGHCVRVRQDAEGPVVLEVAPVPLADRAGPLVSLETCPLSPGVEHLEDYARTADGHQYWVDVRRQPDTGEWVPTPQPRMPMHHSSRLTFQGLADFPGLVDAGDRTVRFVYEQLSHNIEKVGGEHRWRAIYVGRIAAVCAGPSTRAP